MNKQNDNVIDYDYIESKNSRLHLSWNIFRMKTNPICMVWC